jgi:DNA-binding GntR family transcriptional regulator
MPDATPAPRSLTRAVFSRIRGAILAGAYEPGAKLSPRALAAESTVSMSVVREALTRLAEQGLVVAEPQLGFSVVKLDMDDVRDISALRILIEGEALRQAVLHADVEYEARVIASHHRLARTPMRSDDDPSAMADEWAHHHALFHAALLSAAPSPRLRELAETLRETAELYRRWSGMARGEHGVRDVPAEHQALMQAALDRNAERAVVLLTEHINTTTVLLEAYVEQHRPDLVS